LIENAGEGADADRRILIEDSEIPYGAKDSIWRLKVEPSCVLRILAPDS
jgi:hypothetical protein